MSESLMELFEELGITAEDVKRNLESLGPHPSPPGQSVRDDVPISNNGNGEGSMAGYKPGDKVFDYVHLLTQEDLDRAFEKVSEQDQRMLDKLALEIVGNQKGADAHKQFSTRMAFEFLALVGIKMLATPRRKEGRTPSAPTNPYGKDVVG